MGYFLTWIGLTLIAYKIYSVFNRSKSEAKKRELERYLNQDYLKRFETPKQELNPPEFEYVARG